MGTTRSCDLEAEDRIADILPSEMLQYARMTGSTACTPT